jgi:hypothetical protein
MEWFSSITFCDMPPNGTSLAQNLRQSAAKLFANYSPKNGMAGHRWGLRSWFDTASSLIETMWRSWNGSAASFVMLILQNQIPRL